MSSILEEIQAEADRAADNYRRGDPTRKLSHWSAIITTYVGEAFSVRHRDIRETRKSLIKLGGLVVNCLRQIDAGNLGPHEF